MTEDFFSGFIAGLIIMTTLIALFQLGLNRGFDLAITILNKDKNELLQAKSKIILYPFAQNSDLRK